MSRSQLTVDALVVGGGPAGLAAATALRAGGVERVVVVEREDEAGGIPRLCAHTGFGLRDLHRVLRGPVYARRWVERAVTSGADVRTRSMVTGWAGPYRALVTTPGGLFGVDAGVVVLATGARERPRAARLVPGTRPSGIFTTGQLQQWVHREHLPVGRRALVIGAEHVSYSAVLTLREAGVRPVALVTSFRRTQTFRLFDLMTRAGLRVPVWSGTEVAGVYGRERVERVLLRDHRSNEREVAVDTVVFTGDFIPDHELARLAGLAVDPGTRGPTCAEDGTTTVVGVFAAGNLVHPVETADVAAQRAVAVGRAAAAWLRNGGARSTSRTMVGVRVADPLIWVVPNMVDPERGADQPVLVRTRAFLDHPRLDVTQGPRLLASHQLRRMIPNRSHHLPSGWQRLVRPGEDVLVSVFRDDRRD
jgi:thioredoxin reductase